MLNILLYIRLTVLEIYVKKLLSDPCVLFLVMAAKFFRRIENPNISSIEDPQVVSKKISEISIIKKKKKTLKKGNNSNIAKKIKTLI